MLLALEQRVKVPERRLNKTGRVGRHLLEPQLEEDLAELSPHFQERMQEPSTHRPPAGVEVEGLEARRRPLARGKHFRRQIRGLSNKRRAVACPSADNVKLRLDGHNELAALELFRRRSIKVDAAVRADSAQLRRNSVVDLRNSAHKLPVANCDPARRLGFAETELAHGTERLESVRGLRKLTICRDGVVELSLGCACLGVLNAFVRERKRLNIAHLVRNVTERRERFDRAIDVVVVEALGFGPATRGLDRCLVGKAPEDGVLDGVHVDRSS
eukprot:Amastigsp_a175626_546.p2 type:complete len:272 gc:universal Amastigsp_a175626_546:759-1574(+)